MASGPFVGISKSKAAREKFCRTSKQFLAKYGFDGLDFDWEYPGQRGGTRNDKANFAALVEVRSNVLNVRYDTNSFSNSLFIEL